MKIVVCGSMFFAKEMLDSKASLEAKGHTCELPAGVVGYAKQQIAAVGGSEGARRKIESDLSRPNDAGRDRGNAAYHAARKP